MTIYLCIIYHGGCGNICMYLVMIEIWSMKQLGNIKKGFNNSFNTKQVLKKGF